VAWAARERPFLCTRGGAPAYVVNGHAPAVRQPPLCFLSYPLSAADPELVEEQYLSGRHGSGLAQCVGGHDGRGSVSATTGGTAKPRLRRDVKLPGGRVTRLSFVVGCVLVFALGTRGARSAASGDERGEAVGGDAAARSA